MLQVVGVSGKRLGRRAGGLLVAVPMMTKMTTRERSDPMTASEIVKGEFDRIKIMFGVFPGSN